MRLWLNPAGGGVYLPVEDIEGAYQRLRQIILQPRSRWSRSSPT